MNQIVRLLEQLQDTDAADQRIKKLIAENPDDYVLSVNADAIAKRRADLSRRINYELGASQADLVRYHVSRAAIDRYPAIAVAKAISNFQELVTAVFDALRTTPKQRYRPSAESTALSTLDFAMALPVGSILVSMSIENERLLAVGSTLDETFRRVFRILNARESKDLRDLVQEVGIASISKAYAWTETATQFGLTTAIEVAKEIETSVAAVKVSSADAQRLKEAIESESDETRTPEQIIGELIGIDVSTDLKQSYFHISADGREFQGKLSETFDISREWAVHRDYVADLVKVTTVRFATGEEKTEWVLASLSELQRSA